MAISTWVTYTFGVQAPVDFRGGGSLEEQRKRFDQTITECAPAANAHTALRLYPLHDRRGVWDAPRPWELYPLVQRGHWTSCLLFLR